MIAGIFHQGSGLGNQLHRYVAMRVLAADKDYEWIMMNPDLFKGESFMYLQKSNRYWSIPELDDLPQPKKWHEKKVVENGVDIRSYDPEFNFVKDNTIIDGEFQDPRYFMHRIDEVNEWLKVKPLLVFNNVCIIGFRGGEYKIFPDLYLTKDYWAEAIRQMKLLVDPDLQFEVHTDDPESAKEMLGDLIPSGSKYVHDIGLNWRSVRYARYSIISNSSFYILPRLLRHNDGKALTIAPRYWARRNTRTWALPQNWYPEFSYI